MSRSEIEKAAIKAGKVQFKIISNAKILSNVAKQ